MNECKDPEKPHTIWYWMEHPHDPAPVPYAVQRDNRADAMALVDHWLREPPLQMRWIKVFRTGNESYQCFHWHNSDEMPEPPLRVVQDPPRFSPVTRDQRFIAVVIAILILLFIGYVWWEVSML